MSGPMHGREPNRFHDARPVLRAVRRPQDDDGVEPERWSVEIDDETDDLTDTRDIDPGTPIPVDPGNTFGTPSADSIDASGDEWHLGSGEADRDDDDGDDGPAGALVMAGDPD